MGFWNTVGKFASLVVEATGTIIAEHGNKSLKGTDREREWRNNCKAIRTNYSNLKSNIISNFNQSSHNE